MHIKEEIIKNITLEIVCDGDIEPCRALCNELMALQKSRAIIYPESFNSMNFETRMKKSYENAVDAQVIIARDNGEPL